MVDLGFGKCRFALATKKGKDVYGGYKTPVIATKYPAVTKAFFNKKNMDVETIKIEGSVELAPLLELADASWISWRPARRSRRTARGR